MRCGPHGFNGCKLRVFLAGGMRGEPLFHLGETQRKVMTPGDRKARPFEDRDDLADSGMVKIEPGLLQQLRPHVSEKIDQNRPARTSFGSSVPEGG